MSESLNFTIHRIGEGTCDLSGKNDVEVVSYSLGSELPCTVSSGELLKLLRFEMKKLERRSGDRGSHNDEFLDIASAG